MLLESTLSLTGMLRLGMFAYTSCWHEGTRREGMYMFLLFVVYIVHVVGGYFLRHSRTTCYLRFRPQSLSKDSSVQIWHRWYEA